ncbi:MAG: hypothetical protein NTZ05_04630 [Chloroflexi bacterium]|nr:hypothetical protein [Chloroflexota bacterium]
MHNRKRQRLAAHNSHPAHTHSAPTQRAPHEDERDAFQHEQHDDQRPRHEEQSAGIGQTVQQKDRGEQQHHTDAGSAKYRSDLTGKRDPGARTVKPSNGETDEENNGKRGLHRDIVRETQLIRFGDFAAERHTIAQIECGPYGNVNQRPVQCHGHPTQSALKPLVLGPALTGERLPGWGQGGFGLQRDSSP